MSANILMLDCTGLCWFGLFAMFFTTRNVMLCLGGTGRCHMTVIRLRTECVFIRVEAAPLLRRPVVGIERLISANRFLQKANPVIRLCHKANTVPYSVAYYKLNNVKTKPYELSTYCSLLLFLLSFIVGQHFTVRTH